MKWKPTRERRLLGKRQFIIRRQYLCWQISQRAKHSASMINGLPFSLFLLLLVTSRSIVLTNRRMKVVRVKWLEESMWMLIMIIIIVHHVDQRLSCFFEWFLRIARLITKGGIFVRPEGTGMPTNQRSLPQTPPQLTHCQFSWLSLVSLEAWIISMVDGYEAGPESQKTLIIVTSSSIWCKHIFEQIVALIRRLDHYDAQPTNVFISHARAHIQNTMVRSYCH